MRLELDEGTEDRIANIFAVLVIIAAFATLPLTAAYWFEWDHWAFTVGDWVVWSVFVLEYAFYLAISEDRWQTTKSMWLSVIVVLFSFPLLHEILKATRIVRLLRPVPLLRQSAALRQIELLRLSNMRSKGTRTGWQKAKEFLGDGHWITRWMRYVEDRKSKATDRVLSMFGREAGRR